MNNDAVTAAPHIHTILLENDRVRLLDVTMNPGDKAAMHSHPENIVYVIAGALLRFTNDKGESRDVESSAGQVIPNPPATHAVEHIGATPFKAIQIEFK